MATRDVLLDEIWDHLGKVGDEELTVTLDIVRRLSMGARQYGDLRLVQDVRDWRKELRAELLDALLYDSFESLQGRLRAEAAE